MAITQDVRTRLGETEYATFDPRYVEPGQYGAYYFHPDFPDRYDANQLFRVDCAPQDFEGMLDELARKSSDRGLGFRKMSGYDPKVWRQLGPYLEARGWGVWTSALMLLSDEPEREPNPDVLVRSVGPDSPDLEGLYRTDGVLDRGFELARSRFERHGGAYLVGYLDGRPACCTGWYVANSMARFRHVLTAPWARLRGCATSLILHVQREPTVRSQDGLAIMVTPDGPVELYRSLGFRFAMDFWEAKSVERA